MRSLGARRRLGPSLAAMAPAGGGGGGGFAYTYRERREDASDLSAYTFSALDIGTASSDRIVLLHVWAAAGSAISLGTVTLGGNAATAICADSASGQRLTGAYFLNVTSGTTVDAVVNFSGTASRCGVSVATITGTTQTTYAARSGATPTTNTSLATLGAGAITVPSGGVGIASVWFGASSGTISWAQTSGTGTERFDDLIGESGIIASLYDSTEAGSQDFAATFSGAAGQIRVLSYAWGP